MSIPKKIYYCWFGGEPPYAIQKCIESWHRVLPDYEIIRFSEDDIDMSLPYNQKQLHLKKYAYLADVKRLQVLKESPGIYLDTDVYMLKPFPEEMLEQDVFLGADNSAIVACGVIGVSKPNDPLICDLLSVYENYDKDGVKQSPNTLYMKDVLRNKYGFNGINNEIVRVKNLTIYPREYFYPIYWSTANPLALTDNTVAIHLWTCSANRNNSSRFAYEKHQDQMREWLLNNHPGIPYDDFNDIIPMMIGGRESINNGKVE